LLHRVKEEKTNIILTRKRSELNGLVTSCVGTAFQKTLFNERWKGSEDEEDEGSSYYDFKEKRIYCKFKEGAPVVTL
jgi:hypothetical protein